MKKVSRKQEQNETITIPEDVTIDLGDREVILEKGDKVQVIKESTVVFPGNFPYRELVAWVDKAIKANDTSFSNVYYTIGEDMAKYIQGAIDVTGNSRHISQGIVDYLESQS